MPQVTRENVKAIAKAVRRHLYGRGHESPPQDSVDCCSRANLNLGREARLYVFGPNGGLFELPAERFVFHYSVALGDRLIATSTDRADCDGPAHLHSLEAFLGEQLDSNPLEAGYEQVIVLLQAAARSITVCNETLHLKRCVDRMTFERLQGEGLSAEAISAVNEAWGVPASQTMPVPDHDRLHRSPNATLTLSSQTQVTLHSLTRFACDTRQSDQRPDFTVPHRGTFQNSMDSGSRSSTQPYDSHVDQASCNHGGAGFRTFL